ncbi:MAG: peptide deformylase [Sporomusaceae bacterium]|nr:peptide deformylase [Sporomusaceae bacterium]
MAVLDIRKAGDPVLKQKAVPVEKITKKLKTLLDSMAETMYTADGVGLAAPQIGVSQRIIVIDVGTGLIELINPVISSSEGLECATEGCLSVPGVYGDVERASQVTVDGLDRHGKPVRIRAEGLLARALQHEIDHLEGILFIERSSSIYKGSK